MDIQLTQITPPKIHHNMQSVILTDETLAQRHTNFLEKMKEHQVDTAIIYADREHGANFEYFTGFIPRFEEACLVLHSNGKSYLLLGNENLKLASKSRVKAEAIHVPYFSLPNQPMKNEKELAQYFKEADISQDSKVGLIGWKMFTSTVYENSDLFDIPYFVVNELKKYVTQGKVFNFSPALLSPLEGVRTINNANEIAHYEYGASLAGSRLYQALQNLEVGKTEKEIASILAADGQPNSVTTITAAGARFTNAIIYPRDKAIHYKDNFSITVGYKGGLSSRVGYVVEAPEQLPEEQKDYLERLAKPYFTAYVTWLVSIKIGQSGKDMYAIIEEVLPKKDYGWSLNPGHFTSDEEWLASPFTEDSTAVVKSGQMYQVDIIPSVPGYAGASCEEPIAIADEALQSEIKNTYPEVWERIQTRRSYLQDVLNLSISDELLPLSDTVAFYAPLLLNKTLAFSKKQ
ncbi:M24 family metallopeptidase [Oceanobacillus manasiensis]|uniref:M24 family metallopeptidase n=1 Tax=Oceanobacillus manasiensis TaxID=586413 RepID=UPI0005A76107|nr:aminopeptidase P family N-terminal domain-containing protein [Oceanobacillus manasiensis]